MQGQNLGLVFVFICVRLLAAPTEGMMLRHIFFGFLLRLMKLIQMVLHRGTCKVVPPSSGWPELGLSLGPTRC